MLQRRSVGWPVTLGVIMIVLVVALLVGWVFLGVAAAQRAAYFWAVLIVGTAFLAAVLVGVVLYLLISIKEIRLNQRQSNFIDSVTHELKSPIASLKLYLQTLSRRPVGEAQQAEFYRVMLDDVERLDHLINHMLDAARLDEAPTAGEEVEVRVDEVLRLGAAAVCQRHHVPPESMRIDVAPALVRARPIDVEMIFRNLMDNAVKYGGQPPEVEVECWTNGRGRVLVRIADNGPGIPPQMRRKVFGRFVRLGSELERSQQGTGLGLFIVGTLVRRLRGQVHVRGRGARSGTVFEVDLPGEPGPPEAAAAGAPPQGEAAAAPARTEGPAAAS